jgi:two-component system capsular synthesis response regulator RcsB
MLNQVISFINTNKVAHLSMKESWSLVMDACPMTRNGLRSILNKSQFGSGEIVMLNKASEIPICLRLDLPDMIVMELCGEGESVLEGLRVIATCQKNWPLIPLVVCTALSDVRFLQQVKSLTVSSICHKHDPLGSIEECMILARRGIYQDSPTVLRLLGSRRTASPALTKKEIDVLVYLLAGLSVSEMSRMLNRDIRTISSHKCHALTKLGYRTNSDLFTRGQWMLRNGFYNLDGAGEI